MTKRPAVPSHDIALRSAARGKQAVTLARWIKRDRLNRKKNGLFFFVCLCVSLFIHLAVATDLLPSPLAQVNPPPLTTPLTTTLLPLKFDGAGAAFKQNHLATPTTVVLFTAKQPSAPHPTAARKPPRTAPPRSALKQNTTPTLASAQLAQLTPFATDTAEHAEATPPPLLASAPLPVRPTLASGAIATSVDEYIENISSSQIEKASSITPNEEAASTPDVNSTPLSEAGEPPTPTFPHQAHIVYQVFYGVWMAGKATLTWQYSGTHYRLESMITPLIGSPIRYLSEGKIDATGLKPTRFTAWRENRQREHAEFDWENKQLRYGEHSMQQTTLQKGAQDIFSITYQLALKGAVLLENTTQITTGKKVQNYPFTLTGEARLATDDANSPRALILLSETPDTSTQFWLSPDIANQPVRIIHSDKQVNLDMRAIRISVNNMLAWQAPLHNHRKYRK